MGGSGVGGSGGGGSVGGGSGVGGSSVGGSVGGGSCVGGSCVGGSCVGGSFVGSSVGGSSGSSVGGGSVGASVGGGSVGVLVGSFSGFGVLVGVGDSLVFDGVAVEVESASEEGVGVDVFVETGEAVAVVETRSEVGVAASSPESRGISTSVFEREDNGVAKPAGFVAVGTGTGVVGSLPGKTVVPSPEVNRTDVPWASTSTEPSLTATSVTPSESTSTVNSVPRTLIVAAGV